MALPPPLPNLDNPSITTVNDDVISTVSSVVRQAPILKISSNRDVQNSVYSINGTDNQLFHGNGTATFAITTVDSVTQAISTELLKKGQAAAEIVGGGHHHFKMGDHYSELLNKTVPTDKWLNYTCMSSLSLPSGFFKDVIEPVLCGSGIVGIILTMIVLSRKTMVTSTNCYLTALAVADLMYLLLLLARIIIDKIDDCVFQLSSEKAIYSHFTNIFMEVFLYTTIGVTIMLAVERYIAICQPMQAMTLCSVNRARFVIVIITIIAFILLIPKFFDVEIEYVKTTTGESTLVLNWVFPYNNQIYICVVQGFLVTFLPLCCLFGLNLRLIIEIRRSTRYLQVCLGADWQTRSLVTREEVKITMMLISVIVAFFICQAPYMIYGLLLGMYKFDVVVHKMFTTDLTWEVYLHIVQCLMALKSSCNFILYCWFSEKFWITFKRLFCLSHCLPRQGIHQINGCSNNNSNNNHHRPSCYITRDTTC